MPGGGSYPGERRGGRRPGTKNKATVEREIIEAEVRAQRIAAGVMLPVLAKERLEMLLDAACRHMDEAFANGKIEDYIAWFERAASVAKALAPYQLPQLKALAVAHTDMRPPALDLRRLTTKQLEMLRRLVQLAGPTNIAGGGTADERGGDQPLGTTDKRPVRPRKREMAH
jgi:hypothetical protein